MQPSVFLPELAKLMVGLKISIQGFRGLEQITPPRELLVVPSKVSVSRRG